MDEEERKARRLNIIISQLDYFLGVVEKLKFDKGCFNALHSARRFVDELKDDYIEVMFTTVCDGYIYQVNRICPIFDQGKEKPPTYCEFRVQVKN